ncbi:DUF427 domain-containing protein [Nocardia sp. NPDC127606]|uniref:DUF427 domain-containing protein n=1 Tax=Nocardia sp. NPDC127606 TaxID=3345406 RepID=UPI003641B674
MTDRSGFVTRPDYRVDIHARRNRVTVHFGELLVADSERALLVDEQDHGLVFYLPREDIGVSLHRAENYRTTCPFKGEATYWRFDGDGDEPLVWGYEDPAPQVARLRGHVAFYQDRVTLRVGAATPAVSGH